LDAFFGEDRAMQPFWNILDHQWGQGETNEDPYGAAVADDDDDGEESSPGSPHPVPSGASGPEPVASPEVDHGDDTLVENPEPETSEHVGSTLNDDSQSVVSIADEETPSDTSLPPIPDSQPRDTEEWKALDEITALHDQAASGHHQPPVAEPLAAAACAVCGKLGEHECLDTDVGPDPEKLQADMNAMRADLVQRIRNARWGDSKQRVLSSYQWVLNFMIYCNISRANQSKVIQHFCYV